MIAALRHIVDVFTLRTVRETEYRREYAVRLILTKLRTGASQSIVETNEELKKAARE